MAAFGRLTAPGNGRGRTHDLFGRSGWGGQPAAPAGAKHPHRMKVSFPTITTGLLAASLPLLALAVSGCTTSGAPPAQSFADGADARFRRLDADGDGRVTRAEFNAGFAERLYSIYNRRPDGVITKAEWDAVERANESRAESSFRALDRNHDERLTREELSRGRQRELVVNRVFDRVDKNHDGALTLEEARTFAITRATNQDPANHP